MFSDAAAGCRAGASASSGDGTSSAGMCTTSSKAAKETRLAGVVGELSRVLDLLKQPVLRGDSSPKSESEVPPKANETRFTNDLGMLSGVHRPKVLGVGTKVGLLSRAQLSSPLRECGLNGSTAMESAKLLRKIAVGSNIGCCRGCPSSDDASVEATDKASSSSVMLSFCNPATLKLIGSERVRKLRELGVLNPSTSKKVFLTAR